MMDSLLHHQSAHLHDLTDEFPKSLDRAIRVSSDVREQFNRKPAYGKAEQVRLPLQPFRPGRLDHWNFRKFGRVCGRNQL